MRPLPNSICRIRLTAAVRALGSWHSKLAGSGVIRREPQEFPSLQAPSYTQS